jgi:hypothetical protein
LECFGGFPTPYASFRQTPALEVIAQCGTYIID